MLMYALITWAIAAGAILGWWLAPAFPYGVIAVAIIATIIAANVVMRGHLRKNRARR